jgi:cell surface protein SprA
LNRKNGKYNSFLYATLLLLSLGFSWCVTAQDTLKYPINNSIDPTQTKKQSFDLGDPSSMNQTIVYDPITRTYVFKETIGNSEMNYRNPSMMTLDEYIEYERQKSLSKNWKEKIKEQTAESRPFEFPIKVGSKLFENFFGSDQITIRPAGSVELSFGVNSSRYDNPILPIKQRRITRFDFQPQIQLNLVGQIGTKLKIGTSYNTQAAFDFDNISKLEYTGNEDQIMQKIALGNVSMPLPTSLIQGSQTLFGVQTKLKFGRATVDLIMASSKGKRQEINIAGKAQVQSFELGADNYESNRHYFVNLYHREQYDYAMSTLPIVSSGINITRIEVWLTNKTNNTENTRNIIAFSDLGEAKAANCQGDPGNYATTDLPDNDANGLYKWASDVTGNPDIRGFSNAVNALNVPKVSPGPFIQATHYEKVQNARKLTESEFSYNSLLGFISLNMPLNNDEVLAVAYEYTYKGKTYTVGELSTDGVAGQSALIVKLLKPTITNPKNKIWDLMMKNVYSIGAYQVGQQGFRMNFLYNNPSTSLPVPFFPYPGVDDKLLVELLEMDKINQNNQPFSDGVFDFSPMNFSGNKADNGGTINTKNGRVYFSTIEPFGKTLKTKLLAAGMPESIANQVSFTELYDSTKIAAQQIPSKNRFSFKGEYQSSVTSDIPLNALNVPEGAVSVTAGVLKLVEGTDYTVDYNLGRVKILNSGILESNTPIKISIESNSVFGFQSKSLIGGRYNYRFSQNLNVGATWMRMMERPVTQKVDIGSEPFKNNILGADVAFKTGLPFLTKLVDLLPVISTTEKSTLSFTGEFAHIIPGAPSAISKAGISYIDDFEGAQSTIDLKSQNSWKLATIPQGQNDLFPEAASKELSNNFKRSKVAWYQIDQLFYAANSYTPKHIKEDPAMLSDSRMRLIQTNELFPNTQLAYGTPSPLQTLELAYYPLERGMYNYDTTQTVNPDGTWMNPENRWGGIMRSLSTNDFEQSNIQYIQFWMLDPFNEDAEKVNPNSQHTGGNLYFNLGNISEDILPDSHKSCENGLPPTGVSLQNDLDTTKWARVSTQQQVVNAFDNDDAARANQDVGLDGWKDQDEINAYSNYVNWVNNNSTLTPEVKAQMIADPSNDDYTFYRDDRSDEKKLNILQRYKNYNGLEGNSPTPTMSNSINSEGYPTAAITTPDIEDINQDNNLGESESYFQYKVSLHPNDLQVGKNFITSKQEITVGTGTGQKKENWYQFKVPIRDYEKKVNEINDFRSIRFMRMFLKDFDEEVVLRFAKLELIRGEWRKYYDELAQPGDGINPEPNSTSFNIGTVNVEENDQRQPIKYEIPPGITRESDPSQAVQRQLNEQSLVLDVCNLKDGDARAAYKNVQFDVRTYKKLKMFVHAEESSSSMPYSNEDLTLFVRLGSDFTDNYYEYEFPLNKTAPGATLPEDIWPEANNMEIVFEDLLKLKEKRNKGVENGNSSISYVVEYSEVDPKNEKRILKVKGSPNLQGLKTLMIGVRNPAKNQINPWPEGGVDDGSPECAIIWVNELRLTDFTSEGGSAAVAQAQVQAADFGNVSMSGNYSGVNWGSVETRVQERQRNEKIGLDLSTNVQLGQFFGKRTRLSLPFFYGHALNVINPEYDPYNPDIKLADYDLKTRKEKAQMGQDLTERKSYNFTNVRKEAAAGSTPHFWKISNWSASYGFAENLRKDFNTKSDRTKTWTGGLNYNYSFTAVPFEPFKKVKFMQKSKWWSIIKDMNIYLKPKNISFTNDLMRSYNERQIKNNLAPDFNFKAVYVKQFTWRRQYNLGYDITKNLKFTFDATNKSIFEEGQGQVNRKDDPSGYKAFKDTITSQLFVGGKVMDYSQNYSLGYNVPLDKIPAFNWMTANVKYGGSYNWQRAPLGQSDFGNTIQNTRTVNMTGQMNFTTLYNKVPYLKKVNSDGKNQRAPAVAKDNNQTKKPKLQNPQPKVDEKPESEMTKEELRLKRKKERKEKRKERKEERKEKREKRREEKSKEKVDPLGGFLARILMSVRNVSGTYTLTDGTLLPGFNQESKFLGTSNGLNSPLTSFVFGQQGYDVLGKANGYSVTDLAANNSTETGNTSNNWLVKNENINKAHVVTHSQNITIRGSLEPIKDVTIELNMNRAYVNNSSDFFRWSKDDPLNTDPNAPGQFRSQSQVETGTLNYTTVSIGSAFTISNRRNQYSSSTFNKLLENRKNVSELLGSKNTNSSLLNSGYFDGYGGSQQEVVLGAFLTSYTNNGVSAKNINPIKNIPLPNWTVNYNGLTKMEFMKKIAKNFVIRHAYSSTVSIAGLQTNLKANEAGTERDINNNFEANKVIQNVTIAERFSPLIGVDATWNMGGQGLITKFEIKKDRSATLSLNNNQVTEVLGTEWVIGTGYKFTKVKMPIKKVPPSPVNLRFDLSFRDNLTVIRKIVENSNQATAGQKVVSIKSSADYNVGPNLVIQAYYDQVITTPKIATSYPTGNMSCGLRLRFNLAGVQ